MHGCLDWRLPPVVVAGEVGDGPGLGYGLAVPGLPPQHRGRGRAGVQQQPAQPHPAAAPRHPAQAHLVVAVGPGHKDHHQLSIDLYNYLIV